MASVTSAAAALSASAASRSAIYAFAILQLRSGIRRNEGLLGFRQLVERSAGGGDSIRILEGGIRSGGQGVDQGGDSVGSGLVGDCVLRRLGVADCVVQGVVFFAVVGKLGAQALFR